MFHRLFTSSGLHLLALNAVVVSSIDAIHGWSRKARIFYMLVNGLFALLWAIMYRYIYEDAVLHIAPDLLGRFGAISLRERVATCWEITLILLLKQSLLALIRGNEQCIAVKYRCGLCCAQAQTIVIAICSRQTTFGFYFSPYIEWRKTLDTNTNNLFSRRSVIVTDSSPTASSSGSQLKEDRLELLNLFNEKRRKNEHIPLYELIEALGGIDIVMNVMMNAPNLKMMETNLKSIKSLLTEGQDPAKDEVASDANIISKLMTYRQEMETKQRLRWCLDPHNNFLHETSTFLAKYLYSRQMMAVFVLYAIGYCDLRIFQIIWN